MIKLAGPEDSGVTDRVTGRRIYVTTTARKSFRTANPTWAKVRNVLLNAAIATDFARAMPEEKPFRVRKDSAAVGQVRNGSGGQYIAVVETSGVKVVSVGRGGTPHLTAPAPAPLQAPAPVAMSANEFSLFITKHAIDSLCEKFGAKEERIHTIIDMISEQTGLPVDDVVRQMSKDDLELGEVIKGLCADDGQASYLHETENKNSHITDPMYAMQSSLPSSGFAVQFGLSQ